MNTAVIGFGSNINPDVNIEKAKALILKKYPITRESPFMRTEPIGVPGQPDFINGVILIETDETQEDVRSSLKTIEDELGRKRTGDRYGPRIIDLDIVVWNEAVVHQDFHERNFLKQSVLNVLPDLKVS